MSAWKPSNTVGPLSVTMPDPALRCTTVTVALPMIPGVVATNHVQLKISFGKSGSWSVGRGGSKGSTGGRMLTRALTYASTGPTSPLRPNGTRMVMAGASRERGMPRRPAPPRASAAPRSTWFPTSVPEERVPVTIGTVVSGAVPVRSWSPSVSVIVPEMAAGGTPQLHSTVVTTFPPVSAKGDGGEQVTATELAIAPILEAHAWILGSAVLARVLSAVTGIESANDAPSRLVCSGTPSSAAWLKPVAAQMGVSTGSW